MGVTLPGPGPMPPRPLPAAARTLVTDDRFAGCRRTVMDANPRMTGETAGRIVEEGLKFVVACSRNSGVGPTHYDPLILDRTREAIAALGWEADPELWGPPSDETLVSVAAKCQHAPECTIRPMPKPEPPVA
ncbi:MULTISPECIES: hypothetical protein [unclassified Streptomyces]|uniref:hypothetical protein n=1 Tax=unclassified Streptomyces TaxID=2593676 RepID=UPI0037FCFF6E